MSNTTNGPWNLVGSGVAFTGDSETFDINPVTNEAIVTDTFFEDLHTVTLATGNAAFKVGLTNFQKGTGSAFGPDGSPGTDRGYLLSRVRGL